MRTRRPSTIEDLRTAIQALPRTIRLAMLDGLRDEQIIVGAYAHRGGICPMLAVHRRGGQANTAAFARAWDRFALSGARGTQPRPATAHELLVLRTHLQASLLEDEPKADLAAAMHEHRELVSHHRCPDRVPEGLTPRRDSQLERPGDPDRSRELRTHDGWSWTRLVRRYDEYQRLLQEVARQQAVPTKMAALAASALAAHALARRAL
jgi:hypothetical protein